jgi:hypothetical protein
LFSLISIVSIAHRERLHLAPFAVQHEPPEVRQVGTQHLSGTAEASVSFKWKEERCQEGESRRIVIRI